MNDIPIEIETGPDPRAAVIWLHGLGADGNDFVPVIPELALPDGLAVRFVFPHAPVMPVTWNGGYRMRSWYDIVSIDDAERHADEAGIRASRDTIRALIAHENARGIPSERIVIAGFSQGGAMAYTVALTHPDKLAGAVALSAYVPAPDLLASDVMTAHRDMPIFAGHGTQDNVVPYALGERSRDLVQQHGFSVDWHHYPIAHTVSLDELRAIGQWLGERFKAHE